MNDVNMLKPQGRGVVLRESEDPSVITINLTLTQSGLVAVLTAFVREEPAARNEGRIEDADLMASIIETFRNHKPIEIQ